MQVEAQALKELLNMLLLAVLADRSLHGYAVVDALKQCGHQFEIAERAVYPALHRLEHLGLVTSSWSVVGGRSRRTYGITTAGRDRLHSDRRVWEEFATAVTAFVAAESASDP